MRILVCGEGKHDIGLADEWSDAARAYVSSDGWMQPLIRTLRGAAVTISIRQRRDLAVLPREQARFRPMPGGHGDKALFAKRAAELGGFDAVVFIVDADAPDPRRLDAIEAEIQDGFSRIEGRATGIACIPMSASESWLLADEAAWRHLSGIDGLPLPPRPEQIWGARDDPDGDHPHRYFARICREAGEADGTEVRRMLAALADPATLRRRCPHSFARFADQLLAA